MNVSPTLITDVRDQIFSDWGVPVILRQITATYDTVTGTLTESSEDLPVTAIVSPANPETTPNTAGQHRTHERSFLIRAGDLPENVSLPTSRILFNGIEHVITDAHHAAFSGVFAVSTHTLP